MRSQQDCRDVLKHKFQPGSGRARGKGRLPPPGSACFVAGTMVHTKDGLVPIQKLRVGDLVLSQPETKGELSYSHVLNTPVFENQEVYRATYCRTGKVENERGDQVSAQAQPPEDAMGNLFHPFYGDDVESLIATGNHPFWKKGVGWIVIDHLAPGDELELRSGETAKIWQIERVFATDQPGVGWSYHGRIEEPVHLIDFRNGSVVIGPEEVYVDEGPLFSARVFNIEVEGTHTYYAGKIGAWVHDTC
jgi:hypothetical protein